MKLFTIILTFSIFFLFSPYTSAQFDLGKKIKKKIDKELNKAADDAIDETADTIKKGGKNENKETKPTDSEEEETSDNQNQPNTPQETVYEKPEEEIKIWSGYDFVAGDKVIFQDELIGELNGEFPSRWDLISGSAEVATLSSETVIHFTNNKSIIFPLMNEKEFLPDVFTIEFDVYFDELAPQRSNYYLLRFFEGTSGWSNIDGKRRYPVEIRWNEVRMDKFGSRTANFNNEKKNWTGKWKHVAIAFNERSLKVYLDEERMINIPNLGYKPEMFSIGADYDTRYIKTASIKNVRVNEGGKKLYERIIADGKFVTTGILFDTNRSTIKGESMGTINEILNLMKEHSDLKFTIEGHTDSDGDELYNLKLSEERAAAVKEFLIQSGIDAARLNSKGYGENRPVDTNETPEGKANNRRVEFIKI